MSKPNLTKIGHLYIKYPTLKFIFHMFQYDFTSQPKVVLSQEHDDYRWLTLDEALSLPLVYGEEDVIHYYKNIG